MEVATGSRIVTGEPVPLSAATPAARVWDAIVSRSRLSASEVARALAGVLGIPNAESLTPDSKVSELVPERLCRRLRAVPLQSDGSVLVVATSDPRDLEAVKEIEFATGMHVTFALASPQEIDRLLRKERGVRKTTSVGLKVLPSPPRLAGLCIREAIRREATRLEMSVDPAGGTVCIAGPAKDALLRLPVPIWRAVLQTIKTVAGLDAADEGRPQRGRVRYDVDGAPWDLSVATVPAPFGETATVRITHAVSRADLADLGFAPEVVASIRALLRRRGILLVTGRTGSGKATMLQAMSEELLRAGKDLVDLEGGGEREASGRSRDADRVAIVGSVTDAQLAGAAVAAALRGHLVVVTVDAADPSFAAETLAGWGVDGSVLKNVTSAAISLRLVRRLCRSCATPIGRMSPTERRLSIQHGIQPLFRSAGCAECKFSGFSGVIPLARISAVGSEEQRCPADTLKASDLVLKGETTIEEFSRTLGPALRLLAPVSAREAQA